MKYEEIKNRLITIIPRKEATGDMSVWSIEQVLEQVRTGFYKPYLDSVRCYDKETQREQYDKGKTNLPAFVFGGIFKEKVLNHNIIEVSGIVIVDWDGNDTEKANAVEKKLHEDKHTAFSFRSVNGIGIKAGVFVEGIKDTKDYSAAYDALRIYYKRVLEVNIDENNKDIRRLCFVSHDEKVFIKEEFEPFDVSEWTPVAAPKVAKQYTPKPMAIQGSSGLSLVHGSVIEQFNKDTTVQDVTSWLEHEGWKVSKEDNYKTYFTRPGKDSGISGWLIAETKYFTKFTSSVGFSA